MKILIVNYEYPPLGGGGGVMCKQMAEELAKRHAVHVFTTSFRDLPAHEEINRVKIHRVPVLNRKELAVATLTSMLTFFPMCLWWGLKLGLKVKFDVINGHFAVPSGIAGFFVAKLLRKPFVLTLIGGDIYDPTKGISPHRHFVLRKAIRFIAGRSDVVTAISNDTKKRAIRYHKTTDKIKVVPLGLVPSKFENAGREELGLGPDDFYLISIGRLIPRKGYEYLINALSKIPNTRIKLLIIGEGPLQEELEELIGKLKLKNRVKFLGFISEKKKFQYLKNADLYVSGALHEGFGIVFLEAMYVGLPIVATNKGGQTDFLREGRNALLVPIEDPRRLAEAIEKLYREKDLYEKIREENRKDVQRFLIGNTTRLYEEVFEKVSKK